MNKLYLLSLFFLSAIFLSSCKKEEAVSTVVNTPGSATPGYFIKYKFNGAQMTCDSISAIRDTATSPNPHRLIITGTTSTSPFLPKIQIMVEESGAGWLQGMNVTCNSGSSSYVYVKDAGAVIYNSLFSASGVNIFFNHLTYHPNSSLSGTFSGTVKDAGTTSMQITEGSFSLVCAN